MSTNPLSASEYNEYYKRYIDLAKDATPLECIQQGMLSTAAFFKDIPAAKHEYRYKSEKWTPKDILLHLIDSERVFCYRALQFARADNVIIEGFDQDEFVENCYANERTMEELLNEYRAVRVATIEFAKSCSQEALVRMGVANKSPLSVRAALYIIAGHELHHRNIITERYL